ncbi:hypothetical protein NHL50_13370 [Acidimicrobiia bacterium EGI L10123]|uniref:hypothetical protein n=1 Tax=Salinilacustrithrix flava TaxID=2957203 RepID=UPI003D7C2937|nr:hypothetical protein [Acidimicrobiia bacterium EGI L10123]
MALEHVEGGMWVAVAADRHEHLAGLQSGAGDLFVHREGVFLASDTEVAAEHGSAEAGGRTDGEEAADTDRTDDGDQRSHEREAGEEPDDGATASAELDVVSKVGFGIVFEGDLSWPVNRDAEVVAAQAQLAQLGHGGFGPGTGPEDGEEVVVILVGAEVGIVEGGTVQALDDACLVRAGVGTVGHREGAEGLAGRVREGEHHRLVGRIGWPLESDHLHHRQLGRIVLGAGPSSPQMRSVRDEIVAEAGAGQALERFTHGLHARMLTNRWWLPTGPKVRTNSPGHPARGWPTMASWNA